MENKPILLEVAFVRPILIVLLVAYHSFAIYCGAWQWPDMQGSGNNAYFWIAKFSYSFMLETFVFISGYVFAFQLISLNKRWSFKELLIKKIKRLILPSLFFSTVYQLFFYQQITIRKIIDGTAHMWFLPMLFWCFVLSFFLVKIRRGFFVLFLLFLLAVFQNIHLPLQFHLTCYYLFFFYLAYVFYKNKITLVNYKIIILLWIGYLGFFVLYSCLQLNSAVFVKLFRLLSSTFGVCALFFTSLFVVKQIRLKEWVIRFGGYCFGIYIFQQFILQFLYYHTGFPQYVGELLLPWLGFILSLLFSFAIVYLLKKTKFGYYL